MPHETPCSPYLLRPLRSRRETCFEIAHRRGEEPDCGKCGDPEFCRCARELRDGTGS